MYYKFFQHAVPLRWVFVVLDDEEAVYDKTTDGGGEGVIGKPIKPYTKRFGLKMRSAREIFEGGGKDIPTQALSSRTTTRRQFDDINDSILPHTTHSQFVRTLS